MANVLIGGGKVGKMSQDYRIRCLEAGASHTMLQRIKDSCGRTKSQVNARGWLLSGKKIESDLKSKTRHFFPLKDPSLRTWGFAKPLPHCPVQQPLVRQQHTFAGGFAPVKVNLE